MSSSLYHSSIVWGRQVWDRPAVLAATLLGLSIIYIFYQAICGPKLPKLPVVGAKPGEWFPFQRAKWRNAQSMKVATETAYNEYRDTACILPIMGGQTLVHLPYNEFQWLVDQPDSDLDNLAQLMDAFLFDYTIMDPKLTHFPIHIGLLTGQLTREIGNLVPDLMLEIQHAVDNIWPMDTENYSTICAYDMMLRVTGQAINHTFIGRPLCRNPAVLDAATAFSLDVPIAATLLHFFPPILRPFVAPIITLPNRIHTYRFYRLVRPEVRRRLKDYDARRADPNGKEASEPEPKDLLQWSIKQAKLSPDPYHRKVDTLAGRVMLNNFNSIHASSFAATHAILDLAAGKQEYIDELYDEITSVLVAHGGEWSKRALAAMPKLDSTMRESQRLNSLIVTATNRMVANPKGVTTPSGVHLPHGTMVCAPSYPVMHDPIIYPEPETFKPFRFAEKRNDLANGGSSYLQRARQALTTTSPEFPAFGHGRHACAGRFFASSMLRLILAYVVLHYDFEMQEQRAENVWFGSNRIPPLKATIRVKRKTAI
ncbi:cytochrome P450 [Whalleya microplaca]|nr:cytochrome P450 [Whalleya microplaca]